MTMLRSRVGLRRLELADIAHVDSATSQVKAPDHRETLARQAKEQLGFSLLAVQVAQEQEKQATTERLEREVSAKRQAYREIIAMLAAIDADAVPYEPVSVESYKAKMIHKDLPFLRRWLSRRGLSYLSLVSSMMAVTSLMFCIVTVIILLFAERSGSGWYLLGAFFISMLANVGITRFFDHCWSYEAGRWDRVSLEKYDKPMPEFALATAVAIKGRLPKAMFFIDEFIPGHFPKLESRPDNDPFMVVHLDGHDFYIDVWNEPDFKGQRIA